MVPLVGAALPKDFWSQPKKTGSFFQKPCLSVGAGSPKPVVTVPKCVVLRMRMKLVIVTPHHPMQGLGGGVLAMTSQNPFWNVQWKALIFILYYHFNQWPRAARVQFLTNKEGPKQQSPKFWKVMRFFGWMGRKFCKVWKLFGGWGNEVGTHQPSAAILILSIGWRQPKMSNCNLWK